SVHGQLLTELRAHAARGDAVTAEWCQCLETLVEPWLTLQTLADTEPATVQDLAARSQQIAEQIGLCGGRGMAGFAITLIALSLWGLPLGAFASLQWSGGKLSWHAP